jgi:hypothetical protein
VGDCRIVNKRRGTHEAASESAVSELKETCQQINNKHIKLMFVKHLRLPLALDIFSLPPSENKRD